MNQYKLTTIKDIFDKVPTDRVEICMAELTELILDCKGRKEIFENIAKNITGSKSNVEAIFPDSVNWMDDGKGKVTVNQVLTLKGRLEEKDNG